MIDVMDIFYYPLKDADPLQPLISAIEKNEEKILDLNRQQLDRGLDAKGEDLGEYKNINYKGRRRPIDLKLTGSFRDKMNLQVTKKDTEVFSQDQKYEKLKKFRGKDPLGVAQPYISNMEDIIEEDFVKGYQSLLLITTQTSR